MYSLSFNNKYKIKNIVIVVKVAIKGISHIKKSGYGPLKPNLGLPM